MTKDEALAMRGARAVGRLLEADADLRRIAEVMQIDIERAE